MILFQRGSAQDELDSVDIKEAIFSSLQKLGEKKKVLIIPPDKTRIHSRAGEITRFSWEYYKERVTDILPALGTHAAMTESEISEMFGNVPFSLFRVHDRRNDVATIGEIPSSFLKEVSEGLIDFSWPVQMNKMILEGHYDMILSIGQVVPHEVVGLANYNKNIFVGTGGAEGINKSHFLGAVYGMERMMGRADTPVRRVLNMASEQFLKDIPILYVLTVVEQDKLTGENKVRGLFIGDGHEVFEKAAELCVKVNIELLSNPLKKVVVYLDPDEFRSTWLGNKAIYRTRMAIDDDGELIILAPGLKEFGEDKEIDRLIRKYGYIGTKEVLKAVQANEDLRNNLSAAAHLIHGSSEGRFKITYCPGKLTRQEIESVHFNYADLKEMTKIYDINKLHSGFNKISNGEEIFFISNPALGLWAWDKRFNIK